ncbi:hypothetical protein MD484_g2933, partial [Candolleomyces efflorescens]
MNLPADDLPPHTLAPHDDPAPSPAPAPAPAATPPALSHAPPTPPTTSGDDDQADTSSDPPSQHLGMDTTGDELPDGRVAPPQDKDADPEPEIGPQPAQHRIKEEGEVSLDHINGQSDLFEHANAQYLGAVDGSGVMTDDGQTWICDDGQDLKRVYELVGTRWVDKGTAFCFGQFAEETNEALLIARSERNYNIIILSTTIRSSDVYQRQQETLIVWTEPDGVDYALSFQDAEGCSEVWNFILEVQRHMNSVESLPSTISSSPLLDAETSVTTASIIRSGHLPTPTLGIIGEIERAIKSLTRTAPMKDRICEYIQQEDYIKALINVLQIAEELESLENLHALCSLMQTILMLNDHGMYEHIMDDELFYGVVGMLEYDPDFPDHKANYREFLHEQSHFHQPIPIREPSVQRKVHNAYRLQFLKDVVLARAIDDSTFNVIHSCILFNQIDIISYVQHDPHFLRDLISLFVDEVIFFPKKPPPSQQAPPQGHLPPNQIIISLNGGADDDMDVDPKHEEPGSSSSSSSASSSSASPSLSRPFVNSSEAYKELRQYYQQHYSFAPRHDLSEADINLRREVIILLQQLCVMGKNVQLPARLALFRNLVDRGIIFAVQWAISLPDKEEASKSMISAGGEVLSTLLDHDLNGVRSHVIKHVDAIERERGAKKKYAEKGETLLDVMCRIMATTKDMAVQSQIGDALKTWLEVPPAPPPPPPAEANGPGGAPEGSTPPKAVAKKEGDTERFLDYFYKTCASVLFKPLMELPEWKNVRDPILPLYREEANRFTYLADLLHSFLAQHGFRSQLFCLTSSILGRIASLLKAKDKHLRHSAFRIYRFLLRHNSPVSTNLTNMMIKLDVFRPILELTLQESRRDNLLSCSCHELFDSMRRENVKELIKFCMTTHEDLIRKLAKTPLGGQRFELFIKRYEINCQPPPPESPQSDRTDARAWSGPSRGMVDDAEEDYFNGDDTDEEINTVTISSRWQKSVAPQLSIPVNTRIKQRRTRHVRSSTPSRPPSIQKQPLGALLDYDDEDEESSSSPESSTEALKNVLAPSPELFGSNAASTSTPPGQASEEEDEEDLLLESLVSPSISSASSSASPKSQSRSTTPSPSPSLKAKILSSLTLPTPPRMGEKRRREEEEEEDGLERLRKSKKTTSASGGAVPKLGLKSDSATPSTTTTTSSTNNSSNVNTTTIKSKGVNPGKTGDDPPPNTNRGWRVKVGGASWMNKLAPQKSPVTSQPGAKDADTG